MTDQRPQYGELATPEEQRRAAGLPPIDQVVIESPAAQGPATPPGVSTGTKAAATRPHRVDRFVTIALLAYGLINVVVTGLSYLDLPGVMNQTMEVLGVDAAFTNFEQGRTWGTIAAILLVVGWSITAALSIRRLRRGRITWWVPIAGAAATILVVTVCIMVPMMNDPAFMEYLSTAGQ